MKSFPGIFSSLLSCLAITLSGLGLGEQVAFLNILISMCSSLFTFLNNVKFKYLIYQLIIMPITSNTSPIIALAKVGRLKLLKDLYGTVIISPFVKVESVDRGKELGASDAIEIERAIDEGWIKVAKTSKIQRQNHPEAN